MLNPLIRHRACYLMAAFLWAISPQTVSAGNYSNTVYVDSPATLNQPNTRYVLTGDITAGGTAFTIRADNVMLDLNGHTVTFSQSGGGYGVHTPADKVGNRVGNGYYNVEIANGTILPGAAGSGGAEAQTRRAIRNGIRQYAQRHRRGHVYRLGRLG